MYSVPEIARLLGVSTGTIYRLIRQEGYCGGWQRGNRGIIIKQDEFESIRREIEHRRMEREYRQREHERQGQRRRGRAGR